MAEADDKNGSNDGTTDVFLVLVLRYFDGDLDAAELKELNELLRSDETCRRRFLEFCTRGCLIRETFEPERQALLRHEENAAKALLSEGSAKSAAVPKRRATHILVLAGAAIAAAVLFAIWTVPKDDGPPVIGSLERVSGEAHVTLGQRRCSVGRGVRADQGRRHDPHAQSAQRGRFRVCERHQA